MKKSVKTIIYSGIGALGVVSISTPIALIHKNNKQESQFEFNNKVFQSKESLLEFINSNTESIKSTNNNHVFSVNMGNDTRTFDQYKEAIKFIKSKVTEKSVYINPDVDMDNIKGEISEEVFYDKKGTTLYSVFEKYDKDGDKPFKSYTFAKKPIKGTSSYEKDLKNYERARTEAASSFIQVHNAYMYDGVYFSTLNQLKNYLNDHKNNSANFNAFRENSTQNALVLENGSVLSFTGKDDNEIKSNEEFRNNIMRLAEPMLHKKISGVDNSFAIKQGNIFDLANLLDEKDMNFIRVTPNNDMVTQIVDMSNKTENGNIYGNYFVTTGMGVEGIEDVNNWISTDTNPEGQSDIMDLQILKSTMNYLLMSNGISNPIDLFSTIKAKEDVLSFADYLKYLDDKNGTKYLSKTNTLINNLKEGVRYNQLDAMYALHSYLIDKMIQNKEKSSVIIKVAQYFDAISTTLDVFLAKFLSPMLVKDKNGAKWSNGEFSLNYFKKAFSFYDENKTGHGIDFQNSPRSYYRKLLGHTDDGARNVDAVNNAVIFNMIKASMAIQSISMKTFRNNERVFDKYKESYINYLKNRERIKSNSNTYNGQTSSNLAKKPILEFDKNFNTSSIHELQFMLKAHATKSEKESVWEQLSDIKNKGILKLKSGNDILEFNSAVITENYEGYLIENQNVIIQKYINDIKQVTKDWDEKYILDKIDPATKKRILPKKYSEIKNIADAFGTSTFQFLNDVDLTLLFENIPTEAERLKNMREMSNSLVKPLEERIVDFATPIATVIAESAIAVATAGVSVESEMVMEFTSVQKTSLSMSKNLKTISKIEHVSQKTSNIVFRQKSKEISDGKIKKMLKSIDDVYSGGGSGDFYDNMSEKVAGFYGSIYGGAANALGLGSAFSGFLEQATRIAVKINFNVAKNVIPGLKGIINIIEGFSSSKTNMYKYDITEDGSKFMWDGDRVDYSFWGLSAKHTYDIHDLKMIDVKDIISGYSGTSSGIYYNGNFYSDTIELRNEAAQELIEKYLNVDRKNILNEKHRNIKWTLRLKNRNPIETDTINELIDCLATIAATTQFPSMLLGGKPGDVKDIYDSWVENTLENQKKVFIIKLPEIVADGRKKVAQTFELPKPYYAKGNIVKLNANENNKNYITFNPNIRIKGLKDSDLNVTSGGQIQLKTLKQALSDTSDRVFMANQDAISKFMKEYSDNIYVESKDVIFEEINSRNQGFKSKQDFNTYVEGSYESITGKLTDNLKTIYSFVDKTGQTKNYLSGGEAFSRLISPENYNLKTIYIRRGQQYYEFNDIRFASMNDVYDYVMRNTKEKK